MPNGIIPVNTTYFIVLKTESAGVHSLQLARHANLKCNAFEVLAHLLAGETVLEQDLVVSD